MLVAKYTIHGLPEMNAKVERLVEIIKEANSLAEELASYSIEVSVEVVE